MKLLGLFKRLGASAACGLILGIAGLGSAYAAGPGPEICKGCHEDAAASFAKSIHGQKAHPRSPASGGECSTCHGDATEHVKAGGGKGVGGIKGFSNAAISAKDKSETCLACHKGGSTRTHWEGSTHDLRDVTCAACHSVHAARDAVLTKITQPEVCFTCHKQQRSELNRPSRHPILEGKVACSDCHNTHGSVGPKLMKRDSVTATCFQCHMEKRGPFVHNHEPVTEDCSNCHNPHGAVAESMLKIREPFLCHQCHTPHGGNVAQLRGQGQETFIAGAAGGRSTSNPLLSSASGGKSGINYTQGRGCLNCHTQIHGGNNPAFTNPTPQFMFR